jgi:hypothetical protein
MDRPDVKVRDFAYEAKEVVPLSPELDADQLRVLAKDITTSNATLKQIVGHGKVDSTTLGLVASHPRALDDTLSDVVNHLKADPNAVTNVRDNQYCKVETRRAATLKLAGFRSKAQVGERNPFWHARGR